MPDIFATGAPSSGTEILASLRNLQEASDQYLVALPTEVFLAPQGEKWSPAGHVRHLTKAVFPLVRALAIPKLGTLVMFGWNRRPSRPFVEIRETYRAALNAGGQAGRFAPSARPAPPDPEAWRAEVLDRWRKTNESLHAQVAKWSDPALDRNRLPHPLLGKLSVREMLFFTLYHNAHHMNLVASRIERV